MLRYQQTEQHYVVDPDQYHQSWDLGRPEMHGKEDNSQTQFMAAPPSLQQAMIVQDQNHYDPLLVRPSVDCTMEQIPQPWLFQIFPNQYVESPPYSAPLVNHHYTPTSTGEIIYAQPPVSSPSDIHQMPLTYNPQLHCEINVSDPVYFPTYEVPQPHQESDRRIRLSPFSEYDSSSSECDTKDWISTNSLSDYSRSPQPSSQSRVTSARSSPTIGGGYTPDPNDVGYWGGSNRTVSDNQQHYSRHQHPINPVKREEIEADQDSDSDTDSTSSISKRPRKVRRKLAPREREQVHQLRKIGACTKCWGLKMKCDDGTPCKRCEKAGGVALCVRVHFIDLEVFSKWLVDGYSRNMMHDGLRFVNSLPRSVTICHNTQLGANLQLEVHEFIPEDADQLEYWFKDSSCGWRSILTTPFAMKRGVNMEVLDKYIRDHTYCFVQSSYGFQHGVGNHVMSEIFQTALRYADFPEHSLVKDTLQLWTTTQLLIKGAVVHPVSDKLGMSPSPSSASPLPRVLSDQLDHLIERRIVQLEKQVLCELQKRIFARKREDWMRIFLSTVILLNTLERDSWRLYYWIFHMQDGYAWRHPSQPKDLFEKNNILAQSLGAHFAAISKGLTPFAADWSRDQMGTLLGKCSDREAVLRSMERIGDGLRDPALLAHSGSILSNYRQDDESSLDFLYSSKVMIL